MKIYSNTLEREDLFKTCPSSCELEVITIGHPRKAARAWQTRLSCPFGKRWAGGNMNSSPWDERVKAASWDQWGIWMADLFDIDPDAIIGYYNNQSHFMEMTANYIPKGMKAPWLMTSNII